MGFGVGGIESEPQAEQVRAIFDVIERVELLPLSPSPTSSYFLSPLACAIVDVTEQAAPAGRCPI